MTAVDAVVRKHAKALFDGHNGPERGLLMASLALLLLYRCSRLKGLKA
jgi:hypothetical protein